MEIENKHTQEDLRTMQAWSLERKIQVTQTRIIEWYQHWGGQVYIAFSGGKDSTVLLDLARRIYPDIPAVFSDTGLEFPEIRKFVATKENVERVTPEMQFNKVISKYGYPVIGKKQARFIRDLRHKGDQNAATKNLRITGFNQSGIYCPSMKLSKKWIYLKDAPFDISEQCCEIMKKNPLSQYVKKTGRQPIVGTMCEESGIRKMAWISRGCNVFDAKKPLSTPMAFWTEQDVLRYLRDFEIPYCSVYGEIKEDENGDLYTSGERRTGCMFCMFGAHLEKEPNRFQRMKITHPRQWEYCMKSVEEGGLGLATVLDYIGVKYE